MPVASLRSRLRFALAGALVAAPLGCESVRPSAPHPPPAPVAARGAEEAPPHALGAPATAPGKHATRRDYFVLYHDFELDRSDPLFADLGALPDQVFGELGLPPGTGIVQVFLFDTQDRYERYMKAKYRNLPNRRAYFIAEPRAGGADELKIFTWMGDTLATDLRHELTHALLRGVLKDVPLWLDEGLAGYFELPPQNAGVNAAHLDTLRRTPFRPDLARLEKFGHVAQMEKPEYREAWAWVHLMLRSSPGTKKVLHEYLLALRTDPAPGPLLPKLREALPDPEQALVDHLGALDAPRVRSRAAAPK